MKTKPHLLLELNRPDEVAECFAGVSDDLYRYLWNELLPLAEPIPCIEDCGPADVIGIGSVASLWDRIPEDRRAQLNAAAELEDAS